MTFTFETNITCGGCLAKVKPYLEHSPDIVTWAINLEVPEKILTVDTHSTHEAVTALVSQAGYYARLKSQAPTIEPDLKQEEAKSQRGWLQTYKPVWVLVGLLVLVSGVVASQGPAPVWQRGMQYFMGGFFLSFAFFKLLDVPGFVKSYKRYDWLAKYLPGYGYLYPLIEVALGLAYLTQYQPEVVHPLTLALMTLGLGGVIQALYQKKLVQCACLGTTFDLPVGMVTVLENGLMAVMAAWMWAMM